jgi:hypothetical protein
MEFDKSEVAEAADELIQINRLWPLLQSPVVRLAFEQTVRRLGGQVKVYPEFGPEGTWNTDLELAIIGDLLVAKLPCGNTELAVDLRTPHKLMWLYDRYFDHTVSLPPTPGHQRYDVIWDLTCEPGRCRADMTTITATAFGPLTTWVVNRDFQFVGYPWWDVVVSNIIYQYERLILTHASRSSATICFVLAEVESPTKEAGNVILFPKDVVAGYWAKQFAVAAAMAAIT